MTEEKQKSQESSQLTEEKKLEHVAEALGKLKAKGSGEGFTYRLSKVFFGTLYCLSVAFFSCVFGVLAALLLPILLPLAFIFNKFRRKDPFTKAVS